MTTPGQITRLCANAVNRWMSRAASGRVRLPWVWALRGIAALRFVEAWRRYKVVKKRNSGRKTGARLCCNCYAVLTFTMLVLADGAVAETAGDATDPRFLEARQLWLEGRDHDALTRLGDLARQDNVAAQILLSRIADTPWLIDHVIDPLSRAERIALTREPVGLSGRDWMARASETSELARAFWTAQASSLEERDFMEAFVVLVEAGEFKAALPYLKNQRALGEHNYEVVAVLLLQHLPEMGVPAVAHLGHFLRLAVNAGQSIPTPPDVRSHEDLLRFVERYEDYGDHPLTRFSMGEVLYGSGRGLVLPNSPEGRANYAGFADRLLELQPLAGFCESSCAQTQTATCLANTAFASFLSGTFPYPFASPVQSIIEDAEYWASPRFASDVVRILDRGVQSASRFRTMADWELCPQR